MVVLSLAFVIGLALASWWFRSPGSLPVASQLKTRSGTVSEASVTGTDVVFKLHGGSEEYHYAGPQLEEVRAAVYRDASVSILFESAEDAIASGRKIRGTFATVYGVEANDKPVVSYLGQRRHYDWVAGLLAAFAALSLVALVYSSCWTVRLRKEERYRRERECG